MRFSSWWANSFYYWLPPIIWGLSIITMSGDLGSFSNTVGLLKSLLSWFSLTPAQLDILNFYLRKTGHATAYGIFFLLWFRAFRGQMDYGIFRSFFWSMGLCLLVAVLDEYHQSFVSSRTGSIRDVALDLTGSSLAAVITLALSPFFGSKRHPCAMKKL